MHSLAFCGFLTLLAWALIERERRKTQTELTQLQQQHDLLSKTFQHMPDHLAIIDREYRVQSCNWQGIFSHVAEEKRLSRALCYKTFYQQSTPCETCHVRDVFANGQPTSRIKHTREHGYLEIRCFPLLNNEGLIAAVVEQATNVTHRIETDRALRESEKKLQAILHSINDPIRVVDKDLNVVWANDAAHNIFGETLLSKKCCALYELDVAGFKPSSCPTKAALTDGKTHQHILTLPLADGGMHTFKTSSHVIEWDQQRQPTAVLEVFWNITEIKQAESALRRSETLFRTVVGSSKDAMVAIDKNGRITLFNLGAERIFGYSKEEMLDTPVERLMPSVYRLAHSQYIHGFFSGSKPPSAMGKTLELQAMHSNGDTFPVELSLSQGQAGSDHFVLAVIRDITERKLIEQQLIHQANYDSLTGLPNRSLILDRLKQAIALEQRHEQHLAVMMLDLDNFKAVNDTLGHEGGNLLLKEVAQRLSATVRSTDTVGRLYGDEFVIVLRDIGSAEGVMRLVRNLVRAFDKPFTIAGSELLTSFSVGIAMFPEDGSDGDELLKKADTAMYASKKGGKNRFSFFAPSMEETIRQRLQLEKRLQQAVINRDFFLHYQPRIEPASGRIIGLEALLRWSPEGPSPSLPTSSCRY
ncbi:MAG: diguanylate cyclase [Syntrophotaleaceae bacterium]